MLEEIINSEIEAFKVTIPSIRATVTVNDKTKIEHKKIIGIFNALKGGTQPNYNSLVEIKVGGRNVISEGSFKAFLIEKTNSLSVVDSMWKVDVPINTSDIEIRYTDGGEASSYPYETTVYLVCVKK